MKTLLRFTPLLLPLLFVAATCVGDVRRHGTTGPWVGEVTNYGPDTLGGITVQGTVADATGAATSFVIANVCPSKLRPGEHGTFEIVTPDLFTLGAARGGSPPYQLILDPGLIGYSAPPEDPGNEFPEYTGEELTTRLVETDVERRFALVELGNASAFTYQGISVCGNLRTPSGTLAEVGNTIPFSRPLRPGDTQTVPVFFNAMPQGTFEFFPRGQNCCANTVSISKDAFTVTATQVIENGTALRVVGELQNSTGQDLGGASFSAHVEGSWADRIDDEHLGCNGNVGRDSAAPSVFTLPLTPGAHNPAVAIEGIAAYPGSSFYRAPISDVSSGTGPNSPSGLPTRRVSATVSNPTSSFIHLDAVCLNVRDSRGRLVGMAPAANMVDYNAGFLAPGANVRVTADVKELGASASADAIAYGQPSGPPPPIGSQHGDGTCDLAPCPIE